MVTLPDPEPGPGEVVVAVKAAGLCHSDASLFEDEKWLQMMDLPVIPGHEIAGLVESVGPGVSSRKAGDRVVVFPMLSWHGYMRNGGFGTKVLAQAEALVPIPDNVSFEIAATSTDAGMTSHAAVITTGQVKAGERVGIIGFGGLGQIGARVAILTGAEVHVAEINEAAWDSVMESGAKQVVKDVTEFAGLDLDVIVDFAGFGTTTAGAIEVIGDDGRVVVVGMAKLEATINTYPLIMKNVKVLGNVGGTADDIAAVLAWMSSGDIKPRTEHTDFGGIPAGLERLHRGEVRGRLIASYK
ncbi:zinc-binding dehydrogenase [Nocardioides pelophilus]|uniref:zinc-binding dehydrogenase n=1 Tax=Nocardioides pelophilus TaxID=2172019 RepID=UPI001C807981|nr:zinc-binding dehydrogenase [Nocardioides pelophilus]